MTFSRLSIATIARVATVARRWMDERRPRAAGRRYEVGHAAPVADVAAFARRWTGSRLSPRSHGFSLVELMIVLAILVTLAAIAVPNLQRSFQRNEIRDAGRLLQETLGELRQEAMQSGRPIYLQFGWDSKSLRVFRDSAWRPTTSGAIGDTSGGNSTTNLSNESFGSNLQTSVQEGQSDGAVLGDLATSDNADSAWDSQEIELDTDVRFQSRPVVINTGEEPTARPESNQNGAAGTSPANTNRSDGSVSGTDRGSGAADSTIDRVTTWSAPLAILPDGSVEEIQFWLELDRRWQCPVLFRGSTGQLEIGSVQTVRDLTEQPQSRESL